MIDTFCVAFRRVGAEIEVPEASRLETPFLSAYQPILGPRKQVIIARGAAKTSPRIELLSFPLPSLQTRAGIRSHVSALLSASNRVHRNLPWFRLGRPKQEPASR